MVVPEFAGLSDGGRGDVDEMEEQRLKNNMAVKRSRMKSRQKMSQMVDRCGKLRKENNLLELKADALLKELSFLKEMFLTHASGKKDAPISQADMDRIMSDDLPGPELPEPLLLEQTDSSAEDDQLRATRLREGERLWLRGVTSP
ncbi:CCAAT/enhancer-binding protein 2-like [Amphibalanus amphitrite]|uniref:CCAAT/enhancer-binding protein 2-like n=1 Tax=Amphibalanus amphitrite TaxID=1232801 RepID=UPI001C91FF11|nr:CCAAT/enhancer-binding protein 2-like [Amphibalanus amphitrite]